MVRASRGTWQRLAKRGLDLAGATVGLVVFAPVMGAVAIAVRTSMGRPVLFHQERPGIGGKPFRLIKFRTMAPVREGQDMVGSDQVRLTPLGRRLRAWSLDEFPTLWNVVRGDMSLVGPRPLLMRYLDRYTPTQARRHDVKPGVTGWAQINGRNALDWESKFALDVWYVDNWSLALDLRILFATVGKVLRREGISAQGEATMPEFTGS